MGGSFARRRGNPLPVGAIQDRLSLSFGRIASTLADDVRRGMIELPRSIPPKHFYDEVGSQLFDAICDTPEYYPTRTERVLLDAIAADVVADARPTDLIEIGSGAARKTRKLLDAMGAGRYVPIDISEGMLVASARRLLREYPWLRVHGVVADYEHPLGDLLPAFSPRHDRRLFAFLGGTLGNFDFPSSVEFLARIRRSMHDDDTFLLGIDLVKSRVVLHDAYNDAAGITAAFNRNVLTVMNRELGADFDVDAFEHVAFYRSDLEQIEMHLEARRGMRVAIPALGMRVAIAAGERIRTEISRKFTRDSADVMARAAGLRIRQWFTPENEYFALALLEPDMAVETA